MKRRRLVRSLLVWLLVAVGLLLAFAWQGANRLICPPRRALQDYHREMLSHPKDHGLRVEPFTTRCSDGYDTPCLMCEPAQQAGAAQKGNKLRAQLREAGVFVAPWGKIRGTLVLLHGHGGRKEDMLPVAERFCAAGFRCVIPDLPGYGDHPARFATFGCHESCLANEVLHEAARRYHFDADPAGLFGISQGGAMALQTAAQGSQRWFAVAELATFASLKDVVDEQAAHYFGPLRMPAEFLVWELVKWRAGFDVHEVKPITAARRLKLPVFIGHGDADRFIPPRNARLLWAAIPSPHKELFTVPGGTHGTVLATEAPVYAKLCGFFLNNVN